MDVSRDLPKIIFSHPEEMKMLSAIIDSTGNSIAILKVIGMLEIIFGIIWLFPVPKQNYLYYIFLC